MMVQVYTPITREAEARGLLEVLGQPRLHSKPSFLWEDRVRRTGFVKISLTRKSGNEQGRKSEAKPQLYSLDVLLESLVRCILILYSEVKEL